MLVFRIAFFYFFSFAVLAVFCEKPRADPPATLDPFRNYKSLVADGIPWTFQTDSVVVAIGDIHGDFNALVAVLKDRKLIDAKTGKWIGKTAHLVFMGDLIDRGPDSQLVMEFVMDLEKQAEAAGGRVHTLLGNHEALVFSGDFSYVSKQELQQFTNFHDPVIDEDVLKSVYSAESPYGRWVRQRNAIVQINDTWFVHAGVHRWLSTNPPDQINATVRAWFRYYQGLAGEPPANTAWVVGEANPSLAFPAGDGPLWTRILTSRKTQKGVTDGRALEREVLVQMLNQYGAKRLLVGHTPTENSKVMLKHPIFGDSVVMIDTALSEAYGGELSSVEIRANRVFARHISRPVNPSPLRAATIARMRARQEAVQCRRGLQKHLKHVFDLANKIESQGKTRIPAKDAALENKN